MDEEIRSSVDDLNWLVGGQDPGGDAAWSSACSSSSSFKAFERLGNGHRVSLQSIRRELARFTELEEKFPGTDQQAFRALAKTGLPGCGERDDLAAHGSAPLSAASF